MENPINKRRHDKLASIRRKGKSFLTFLSDFGFIIFIFIMFSMLISIIAFSQDKKGKSLPTSATYIQQGDDYIKQGDGGKAITAYENAADLDVRNALPHYKIGQVYNRSTNKDAALEAFNKAVSINPTYAPAWKEIAEIQYAKKNGVEAAKAQAKYLQLVKPTDDDRSRYGFYLTMAKDFTAAAEAFKQVHDAGALKGTGLKYYAMTLNEKGDFAEAEKVFEEYIQSANSEQIEASDYAMYSKMLLKLDEDSLAIIAIDQSLAIDGKQVALKQVKAETLYKAKRYPESVVAYDDLIASRTKATSQDLFSLGRGLYYSSNFKRADSTFRKLTEAQPAVAAGFLWAARSNSNLDPESTEGLAKPFYEKLIELSQAAPDKSKNDLKEAYLYLGYYHLIRKEIPLSKTYWEKVLAIDPQNEQAQNAMKHIKAK